MSPFYKISQGWRETCYDTWDAVFRCVRQWVEEDKDHAVTVVILGTPADKSEATLSREADKTQADSLEALGKMLCNMPVFLSQHEIGTRILSLLKKESE